MLTSRLKKLLLNRDQEEAEKFISRLHRDNSWSAISFIDEMLPLLLFQSNLKYGNFHQVKMALQLRHLLRSGKLSRPTQRAVMKLLIEEGLRESRINVEAGEIALAEKKEDPLSSMLEELSHHSLHNAFYYALQAYEENPDKLLDLLLSLGGVYGPENLGHSLSCFFPVIEEIVSSNHPVSKTALFSYILYLGRYDIPADFTPQDYKMEDMPDNALRLAASGEDIVNLHHMITLATYRLWEQADFHNDDFPLPYRIFFQKRLKGKEVSKEQLARVKKPISVDMPKSYENFREDFSYDDVEHTTSLVRRVWQEAPEEAWDWVFRLYAEDYRPQTWNPHFYTGIYLAFRLDEEGLVQDRLAAEMAVDQAVAYYVKSLSS